MGGGGGGGPPIIGGGGGGGPPIMGGGGGGGGGPPIIIGGGGGGGGGGGRLGLFVPGDDLSSALRRLSSMVSISVATSLGTFCLSSLSASSVHLSLVSSVWF